MLSRIWYWRFHPVSLVLWPLSGLYGVVSAVRRWAYRKGYLKSFRLPVTVLVIGNIVVGGSGKTPLVVYVCEQLRRSGYQPGIISRGYGGKVRVWPQAVHANSDPRQVGDEPVLLATRTACPVVVGPDRVAAGKALLRDYPCTILIADDGLQHYALQRDVEIAVVDGKRRYGNVRLLPAGPLREPLSRLANVDIKVSNGGYKQASEYSMQLVFGQAYALSDPDSRQPLHTWAGKKVHAIAGIGHPERFFEQLETVGIQPIAHSFPDHYMFQPEDLCFQPDLPLLMTEKDAVKCRTFALENAWVVPIDACLEPGFSQRLLAKLAVSGPDGQKTS